MNGCRLSPVAFGLAFGILWGLNVLILGLVSAFFNFGTHFVSTMNSVYPGYGPTVQGSILGGLVAFIDTFVMGFLIAWIYNALNNCNCVCCDKDKRK